MSLKLGNFGISERTGFLPPEPPLRRLPGEYFSSWEDTCTRIPLLIKDQLLRAEIDALPEKEFNKDTLKNEQEWQRAYVLLSFLGQAYIWAKGKAGVIDKLPKKLAVPWCTVSEYLGINPSFTYAGGVLYNYSLQDSSRGMVLDNLVAISSFTGTEDESWFYVAHVIVELAAAPGLAAIPRVYEAMARKQDDVLAQELQIIEKSILTMRENVKNMYQKCSPSMWYKSILPFYTCSRDKDAFPNGLIYEGVASEPRFYNSASAAQTSTLTTMDILLGLKHKGPAYKEYPDIPIPTNSHDYLPNARDFLVLSREYNPGKHREFLITLDRQPSLREYVVQSNDPTLIANYNKVLDALVEFRRGHLNMVKVYIIKQIEKHSHSDKEAKVDTAEENPIEAFMRRVMNDTATKKIQSS